VYKRQDEGSYIPKDESVILPPFKDVLGNDLQYFGKCPSQAEFVESPCFKGDDSGYIGGDSFFILGNDDIDISLRYEYTAGSVDRLICGSGAISNTYHGITYHNASQQIWFGDFAIEAVVSKIYSRNENHVFDIRAKYDSTTQLQELWVNGEYYSRTVSNVSRFDTTERFRIGGAYFFGIDRALPVGDKVYDVRIKHNDTDYHYSLTEPIKDAANHIYHDIVGGNHASLINGSFNNEGRQDVYHWGQMGAGSIFSTVGIDVVLTAYTEYNINLGNSFYFETWLDFPWGVNLSYGNDILAIKSPAANSPESSLVTWGTAGSLRFNCLTDQGNGIASGTFNISSYGKGLYKFLVSTTDANPIQIFKDGQLILTPLATNSSSPTDTFSVNTMTIGARAGNLGSNSRFSQAIYGGYVKVNNVIRLNPLTLKDELNPEILWQDGGVNISLIPASATDSTKDALGNPLTLPQDGKSFLDTCKLQHYPMARVVQADSDNVLFDVDGVPISNSQTDFIDVNLIGDQTFADTSETDKASNIRTHKQPLTGRQLDTEIKITNN
jgi:hypothetical protein